MNERARRLEKRLDPAMVVAALLVLPAIVIEQAATGDRWRLLAVILNWVIWIAFALELGATLAISDRRWRWLRSHPLEVAIVILTPPFAPASLQAARALRLARLVRLLQLARLAKRVFSLDGLRYVSFLAIMTALGGGAAFAAVEGEERSTWDGVWWAVTTMTTVGYGDISPATDAGRAIAIGVMLVGIGFIAVLTAAIAERFLSRELEASGDELEIAQQDLFAELRRIRAELEQLERRFTAR